ncbi:MAG: 3-deoxy-manno-octulosonate cytidylyltransferase [Hyphomicrobiaceae bacterium hypho_1]
MLKTLIIIPARMKSTRLPNKPLLDINGEPMIVHCWRNAVAAKVGRVVVATDTEAIVNAVHNVGGETVMTSKNHISGSDRVFEAVNQIDPEFETDIVINLQGDLPVLDPSLVAKCLLPLNEPSVDIATLAAPIKLETECTASSVVKVVGTTCNTTSKDTLRALYFTRAAAPFGHGMLYHHIGIYAYRRTAIERFASLKTSPLELRENLEQLRAIENGMRIDVALVDTIPLGVDTEEDLERARKILTVFAENHTLTR